MVTTGTDRSRLGRAGLVVTTSLALAGCTPAVDPNAIQPLQSSPVSSSSSVWTALDTATARAAEASSYQVKVYVHARHGATSGDLSVHGSVGANGAADFQVRAGRESYEVYRDGTGNYYAYQDVWHKLDHPLDLNWFGEYRNLLNWAQDHDQPLSERPRKFVGGEFCRVYEVSLPATVWRRMDSLWDGAGTALRAQGDTLFTFAVGISDDRLHQVTTTQSIASASGATTMTTDVIFFNYNDVSQVAVPSGLPAAK
ncbi:hypothetical protein [Alicyclobacillus shizuokensis]|uniref:hypothetical protein n=1 Tax=Alicyclobacillus shizuokensis TaxID=392014 RepID=UPI00082BA661|nr:hypothetical protein [Alicyclobacillus shizuokensis]MCL6625832.1 hypothetical protein [Alicyclobacillus shizuokensis]